MRQFVTSVSSEPWSKAQIEALLARENYSYQKIALPHGLTTPGKDRLSITHKSGSDDCAHFDIHES